MNPSAAAVERRAGLHCLRREIAPPVVIRDPDTWRGDDRAGAVHIRCPRCSWQPAPSSRWMCVPVEHPEHYPGGCGTVWNTFETRGRCPACEHVWEWTSCLACRAWSLHEDWYALDPREDDDRPGGRG